jgi:diguanylate cyclase (GGDEF)-like protein/PAS domain S-box-containing protein
LTSGVNGSIVEKLEIGYLVISKKRAKYTISDINQKAAHLLTNPKDVLLGKSYEVIKDINKDIHHYIQVELDYPSNSVKEYKLNDEYKLIFVRIYWEGESLVVTLRDASKQFQALSNHETLLTVMNDMVVVINEDFIIKQLILDNSKYNIDKTEIINNSVYKFFKRIELVEIEKKFLEARATNQVIGFIHEIIFGKRRYWFDINIKYIKQIDDSFYVIKMKDITNRYKSDNQIRSIEERYKRIISLSSIGTWEYHAETGYLWCNDEYFNMLGYERSEFEQQGKLEIRSSWISLLHPDDKDRAVKAFNSFVNNSRLNNYEIQFRLKKNDGSYAWIWAKSNRIVDSDGVMSDVFIGTHIDITEQVEAENLAQSKEKQLQILINQMKQGFVLHEMVLDETGEPVDFIYVDMNEIFEEMSYHSKEELLNKAASEVNPRSYKSNLELYKEVAFNNKVIKREYYSDRTNKYFRDIVFSPKKGQFAIVCEDITDAKLKELELEEKTLILENINHNMSDLVSLTDLDGNFEYLVSGNEIIGYTKEELERINAFDLIHPEDKNIAISLIRKMINQSTNERVEHRLRCKDGSYIWVETIGKVLVDKQGKKELLFTSRDITKRKQQEEELKASEARYETIIKVSNTGVWEYYEEDNYQWCSNEYFTLLGYDPNNFSDDKDNLEETWINLLHPEDKQEAVKTFIDYIKNPKGMYENHFRMRKADGSWAWISSRGEKIKNEDGSYSNLTVGSHIDLTDLKESEQRFRSLFTDLESIGVQGFDKLGNVTYWNKASERIYGYTKEEAIGKNVFDLIVPKEYAPKLIEDMKGIFDKENEVTTQELRLKRKDGSYVDVLTNHTVINVSEQGKELFSLDVDITERKQMEELLHLEKEHFRTTLLSVGDGVIATDRDGKITLMNKVAEQLTGWSFTNAKDKQLFEVFNIIDSFSKNQSEDIIGQVLTDGEIIGLAKNTMLVNKDGEEIPIEDSAAPIHDKDGKITGVVLVFRDYSEKKRQQERIEYLSRHDGLTGLFNRHFTDIKTIELDKQENLPLSIFLIDINGLKLTNDAFGHAMGDKLLKEVAQIIRSSCREGDVIGRIGGDEFLIALPNTNKEVANKIQERILTKASNTMIESIAVSIAIGFEVKENPKQHLDDIKSKAEDKMYKSKLIYGKRMRLKTISTIIDSLYEKVEYEKKSNERVSDFAVKIGKELNLDNSTLEDIRLAATLHDIGKIMIPERILNKPSSLTEKEFESVKKHSETGYHILRAVDEYVHVADCVLYHHERWDGNGYPRRLKGEEIPLIARIVSIADAYEAITSARPYHKAKSKQEAISELKRNAGKQFDPEIIELFINNVLD